MTDNMHRKVPASELFHALLVSLPPEGALKLYEEPELSNHLMQVLMNPLKDGQAPRKNFLVKELLYVPSVVVLSLTVEWG